MSEEKFDNIDELKELINLSDGIISTYSAYDFKDHSSTIEDSYRSHAETHISLGDTSDFEKKVYDKIINNDKPTKGYVYGPYGYGKTSTMVSIWSYLEDNNIIAVPPFTCDSFSSIMQATYGWMNYKLKKEAPDYIEELKEIREKYMLNELKKYAKQKKDEMGMTDDIDKILTLFKEMKEKGELDISIPASALVKFLNECTNLALEIGYDGLAVLPDELQQYFKIASSKQEAEARFRQLVLDLHAGAAIESQFCLLFSMPDREKSNLDSSAGDVLDRLQRDNLSINLKNVYGQEFPTRLWNRYSKQFSFQDYKNEIITKDALNAIGQICSRQDLSDGPRTVIDLFRIALNNYMDSKQSFNSLKLGEVFFKGLVRYDGPKTKIQTAIRDALQNSKVDTEEKRNVIKLCAVFPREGLKKDVQEKYGVKDALKSLSKKLHGDVLTVIGDGYTLVGVTPEDRNEDFIQDLFRRFWDQFDTDDINAKYAMKSFCNKGLNENVFKSRRGKLTGWTTSNNRDFTNESFNVYEAILTGSFSARYPDRIAKVKVTDDLDKISIEDPGDSIYYFDIRYVFVFDWENGSEEYIERYDDKSYIIHLNAQLGFEDLPNRLQFLRETMNPNDITPFLLLSLIQFIEETDLEFDAGEMQQIKALQNTFIKQAIYKLFNEDLIQNSPIDLQRAGQHMVEEIFDETMNQIYPEYETFISSTQYTQLINDYVNFIRNLSTTSRRRGRVVIEDKKENIASLFGLKKVSSLKNRIKKQYDNLIELIDWSGDVAKIRAKLHPLENHLLNKLEENGNRISEEEFQDICMDLGYLKDEIEITINLLQDRGLAEIESQNGTDYLCLCETDINKADVEELIKECYNIVKSINHLDSSRIREEMEEELDDINTRIEELTDDDGEQLEELLMQIKDLKHRLESIISDLHNKYVTNMDELLTKIKKEKQGMVPKEINEEVKGSVKFVGHLNDARTALRSEYNSLLSKLRKLEDEVNDNKKKHKKSTLDDTKELWDCYEESKSELKDIKKERDKLSDRLEGFEKWRTFTTKAGNVKNRIMTYCQTFKEDIEEKTLIEDLIARISEDFTEEPKITLQNVENYKERLDEIADAYKQRQRDRKELFDKKREKLDSFLKKASNKNAKGLRRAPFDSEDPEQSHRDLLNDFKEAYKKQIIDKLESKLKESEQDLEYAKKIGGKPEKLRDPDEVLREVHDISDEIEKLNEKIDSVQLNKLEQCEEIVEKTKDIYDQVIGNQGIRDETKKFLRPIDLDDEELKKVLEKIPHGSLIDFKELLMGYSQDDEDVDPEILLKRIVKLFQLNRVDIKINNRER